MSARADELVAALIGGDEARAENAATAFAELAPSESAAAFELLSQAAVASNTEQRWWAARALSALAHVDVLPPLLALLQDINPAVRQCAALGLRLHPDMRAIPSLATALGDADALVSRLAVDAMIAIGVEATPALLEVLSGSSQKARLGALRALAAIGDQRSIAALFSALEGSALMEYWAGEGLERMGVGMSFFTPD